MANVQWRAQDWLNFVIGTTTADPATCDPNSPPTSGVISAAFSGIDNLGFPAVYYDNATGLYLGYDMQGVLPGRGVVLGGAVLTQTRFARGACPGDFVGSSPASGGPAPNFTAFGLALEPDGAATNWTAEDGTVLSLGQAYVASHTPGAPSSTPPTFQWFLSAYDDLGTTVCDSVGGLLDGGSQQLPWVDGSTASLQFSFAALNAELGRVAHIKMRIEATHGGLWVGSWRVASVLLSPYGPMAEGVWGGAGGTPILPGLSIGLDVMVCIYTAYMFCSMCKRCLRGVLLARSDVGCGRRGARGAVLPCCCCPSFAFFGALNARLPILSLFMDWGVVGALSAAIATWALHCKNLILLQQALASVPSVIPTCCDADGYFVPGPGSIPVGPPGTAPPWATVEALAGVALDSYVSFQTAAVLGLVAIALRTLKYISFQAHLGVFGATLSRSASDMAHFALPLVLSFIMFGVWAMFLWGHHSDMWKSLNTSVLSTFRFLMYDYDIATMMAADTTGLTPLFYIAFMIGITNIMLWLVRIFFFA